LMTASQ